MGNNAAASRSPAKLDSGKPRVKSIGSGVLPANISSIVAEYLSGDSSEYVKAALLGVQPINLCLSNKTFYGNKSLSSFGLVSLEDQWVPWNFKVDKHFFSVADQQTCLHFLEGNNSSYCRIAVEVLTVVLNMRGYFSANVLDDLRNSIMVLQEHLKSVKHVVIYVDYYMCLIFSLNEVIITADGVPQSVDTSEALFDIIDDLQTCWIKNYLTTVSVFGFYFQSNVQQKSEKYLAKFVCDWKKIDSERKWGEEALRISSSKIKWVLKPDDWTPAYPAVNEGLNLCHAAYWTNGLSIVRWDENGRFLLVCNDVAYRFQNNPVVERIVIDSKTRGETIKLPRPKKPLADPSLRSALIELTLEGYHNTIHLTDLNNGYFPHLRHLTVIGGTITGHLDSHRVPFLETLILEPGIKSDKSLSKIDPSLAIRRAQSLLRCGRPWQIVATQANGGWSFASYDGPTTNPQNEVKEDSNSSSSSHALPRIRELVLVVKTQENADEWQKQLTGFPSLEAANNDHKDRLLVWEPQCVEKIIVRCGVKVIFPRLDFTEAIPEQPRILNSLICESMSVDIDGAAVPNLQSLEVNNGVVKVSNVFPSLQRLEFFQTTLQSPWQLEAPLLQSLDCYQLNDGQHLSICPKRLPKLSLLEIMLGDLHPKHSPVILDDEGGLGFSRVNHAKFGYNMVRSRYFDLCQANSISNLVININVLHLPTCWENSEWLCETLEVNAYALTAEDSKSEESLIEVQLPFCPRVKTLTVTETKCRVLLNERMPNVIVCSLPSPKSLGRNLFCPALKRIRFTEKLSDIEKELCLNRATYVAIGAQPSEIIFAANYEFHTMAWNAFPNGNEMLLLDEQL